MGYRHDRDELLDAAVDLAMVDGVSTLTFGAVAAHVGTNDRTVVYYFPTKADLLSDVATAIGGRMQEVLDEAFGDDVLPSTELLWRAWPELAYPDADPLVAAFLEVLGRAAAGLEPFVDVAAALLETRVEHLVRRIDPEGPRTGRAEARAVFAQLDGLLLLRRLSGARAATTAARHLGIVD